MCEFLVLLARRVDRLQHVGHVRERHQLRFQIQKLLVFVRVEQPVGRDRDEFQPHTTFDLTIGKNFGERFSASVQGINVANRRVLLDNSFTFGGTHFLNPREVVVQLRYRFHY